MAWFGSQDRHRHLSTGSHPAFGPVRLNLTDLNLFAGCRGLLGVCRPGSASGFSLTTRFTLRLPPGAWPACKTLRLVHALLSLPVTPPAWDATAFFTGLWWPAVDICPSPVAHRRVHLYLVLALTRRLLISLVPLPPSSLPSPPPPPPPPLSLLLLPPPPPPPRPRLSSGPSHYASSSFSSAEAGGVQLLAELGEGW
jgi:hypothetical protein